MTRSAALVLLLWACASCTSEGGGEEVLPVDAGAPDSEYPEVTVAHCTYAPVPATSGAGGVVEAGLLEAGAAELVLGAPIGTALGAFTARSRALGNAGRVDSRKVAISGAFNPSVGVETAPRVRAVALSAGDETIVLIKADLGFISEDYTFELEARLGPELAGKVLIAASHTHSGWGQHSGHSGIGWVGAGVRRQEVHDRLLGDLEAAARAALAGRRAARLGIHVVPGFDAEDQINRDRRTENDVLAGGRRDDNLLFLIRIDGADGAPIAAMPVFGIHGTILDEDNPMASVDAPGAIERALEEQFDSEVVVMHLQGAAGDVSPVGHGNLDCAGDRPCHDWLRAEGVGRIAAPVLKSAWDAAEGELADELALEMVTRSVPLGPDPAQLAIRGGTLTYAPFDGQTPADRVLFTDSGQVASPIDEFNAPVGAALCQKEKPLFVLGTLPGTEDLVPYGSCMSLDVAGDIMGQLLEIKLEAGRGRPLCQSTRTTVSALRLGEYLVAALPGEVTTLLADIVRAGSPVASERTIVLGYAQGFVGYLLTPEDWLQGGYEASINLWGPLEGEYLAERAVELLDLAATEAREDGSAGGDRYVPPELTDDLTTDDAPEAGTVPPVVPEDVWAWTQKPAASQPDPVLKRVSGAARFVWIGSDPLVATPLVTLEREIGPGVFEPVRRRSGRVVSDGDLLLTETPVPLMVNQGEPRTHYWVTEWQAVPWLGSVGPTGSGEELGPASVPLGRYRFHVVSSAYEIWSDPFEVEPAELVVAGSRSEGEISVIVTVVAPRGYRLLDYVAPSDGSVPLKHQLFDVTLRLANGDEIGRPGVASDGAGKLLIDAGAAATAVVEVRVVDTFGNSGAATL